MIKKLTQRYNWRKKSDHRELSDIEPVIANPYDFRYTFIPWESVICQLKPLDFSSKVEIIIDSIATRFKNGILTVALAHYLLEEMIWPSDRLTNLLC